MAVTKTKLIQQNNTKLNLKLHIRLSNKVGLNCNNLFVPLLGKRDFPVRSAKQGSTQILNVNLQDGYSGKFFKMSRKLFLIISFLNLSCGTVFSKKVSEITDCHIHFSKFSRIDVLKRTSAVWTQDKNRMYLRRLRDV